MRIIAIAILALLVAVPLATAGSAEDPEITDPGTDAGSRPGMDVDALWLSVDDPEADDPVLRFTLSFAGDPRHTPSLFALHEEVRVNFVTDSMPAGAVAGYVSIRPSCSSTVVLTSIPTCLEETVSCRLGYVAVAGAYMNIPDETPMTGFINSGDEIGCAAAYSVMQVGPGATISDMFIQHRLMTRGPLSGGDNVPPTALRDFDRAPNTGFGRAFTLPAPAPAAPEVTFANLTAFPFLVAYENATSGIFQYNWTGDAAFRFVGEVTQGNLTINVTAGGNTVFLWNGTVGLDEAMSSKPVCVDESVQPVACDWTFTYELADFVGMYGIDFAVNKTVTETNATEGPDVGNGAGNGTGNVTGNGTADVDGTTPGKESPGAGLPLVMALLASVAIARARRK